MANHTKTTSTLNHNQKAPISVLLIAVTSLKQEIELTTAISLLPFADEDHLPFNSNTRAFPRFELLGLPLELRTKIWHCTLPSQRNLPFPLFSPTTTAANLRQRRGEYAGTFPIALSICAESRSIAQKQYQFITPISASSTIGRMCIAPSKDLLHLPYALLGHPSFLPSLETLLITNPSFLSSIRYLEIRGFHWGVTGPRWHAFLQLVKHLTGLKELYLDFSSRFMEGGGIGVRWEVELAPARRQLRGLKRWFLELARNGEGNRSVPEICLYRARRRMVRFAEEDREEGVFELPDVLGR